MMKMNRKLLGAVALFAMFSAFEANAQETRNLNVTAEVLEACVIDSPATIDMAFGALDAVLGSDGLGADYVLTADFDFHCTADTAVNVELGLGAGAGATLATRIMNGAGTNTLAYRLETTGGADWGTTAQTAAVPMTATGWATTDTATIQGRITTAQVAAAAVDATYQDTVLITLTL